MAYTATKFLSVRPFPFPRGFDNTQRMYESLGNLVENDTATQYSVGGIGSTSFQVTAFSAVGLVTYSSLVGMPLVNGQRVVVYNTASNTNDGTFIVSALATTSSSAGTFTAVPIPGKTLSGSAQTSQTAEGVGQMQFGTGAKLPQTFTATAVTVSGGIMTVTYTTLTGPQLWPGDSVLLAGMTNGGNNGSFSMNAVFPTSSTAGSFTVNNASAVATDSGTGTGYFSAGAVNQSASEVPVIVEIFSSKGWVYRWDATNYTFRIYVTGTSANTILNELAVGANAVFDGTLVYRAMFVRSQPH